MFFEKQGPVWETLRRLEERLRESQIDYVVIGGLALNAYGYRRQTVDVDVVLRPEDFERFRQRFETTTYQKIGGAPRRYRDAESEVSIDILLSGAVAGDRKRNQAVRFPDPDEAEVHDDIRTVSLARLIELKLVTWRYKDWGDVVELIRAGGLDGSFAEGLAPTVKAAYLQCCDQAKSPGYEGP